MMFRSYVIGAMCGLISITATAQTLPYTFQPGTPAQASQVNANFQDLNVRLNASLGAIVRQGVTVSNDTGVASATCPATTLVVAAGCSCSNVNGTKDYGVLFGCEPVGNGAIAGCFAFPDTFLPPPRATVTAVCMGGRRNDGSIILPGPISAADPGLQKTGKELSDELEIALKAYHDAILDQSSAMKGTEQQPAQPTPK